MIRNTDNFVRSKKINIRLMTEARDECSNSKLASFMLDSRKMLRKNRNNTVRVNSKKNINSIKNLKSTVRKQGCLLSISSSKLCKKTDVIKQQIFSSIQIPHRVKNNQKQNKASGVDNIIEKLIKCYNILQSMLEALYSYKQIQQYTKQIANLTRSFLSPSLQFYVYCSLAFLLSIYDSYSLTLYYLDKGLKIYTNKKKYRFQRQIQISAFQLAAKVFIDRRQYEKAKYLAYMYLRKAWYYTNVQEELNSYDMLGQIYIEIGCIELSKYFHHRMCKGALQSQQNSQKIMIMSNNQLRRQSYEKVQFFIGENINCFAERDKQIIRIIEKHFKSEAQQHQQMLEKKKYRMIYTHRSPNRNFKNYRLLERGMIEPKQSPQIHFVKPRNLKNIRKIINQVSGFFFELKKQIIYENKYKAYYQNQSNDDSSILQN